MRDPASDPEDLKRRSRLRADRDLIDTVQAALSAGARRAGAELACRAGCSECCVGPFPINRLDAWRLAEGMDKLRRRDPARADAIEARARRVVEAGRASFPGDAAKGKLSGDEAAEDAFFDAQSGVPCPALDPATQTCDLYAHRPMTCRTYGLPVNFGAENLPPCRLCFTRSTPETIESCRVTPDKHGIEKAILNRLRRDGGDDAETIVAYAVLAGDEGRG
ncbi:MAG TPA: YkgJ family cysteine cluster protein [Candidatus Polarisedimenticolia bacterium]|nr:YkgJ family cysteine cluster protein [Candidatus Polarisedimenticolia bacterium]